jgi:LysM repeat protein
MVRTFVSDIGGMALRKEQEGHVLKQLVVNGNVITSYGNGTDPNKQMGNNGKPNYIDQGEFGNTYQQITTSNAAGSTSYTVKEGDTLQSIAQAMYGDASLWYRIADANGLSSPSASLQAGTRLSMPNQVGGLHNSANTFKPYDPSKVTGDTTPNMPMPPVDSGGGCGGLGQILMIIIIVVVAVYTGGAALAAMGGATAAGTAGVVAAGAIGGAVGSIAGQIAGNALGIVDGFSWKAVALAAIGGAVTAGIGGMDFSMGTGSGVVNAVVRSAVSSAMTQGIAVVTGLQEHFNWRQVAMAGVSAGVGYGVNELLTSNVELAGPTQNGKPLMSQDSIFGSGALGDIARSGLTRLASGITSAAVSGGRVNVKGIAIDAFGNALGDSLGTQVKESMQETWLRQANAVQERKNAQVQQNMRAAMAAEDEGWAEQNRLYDLKNPQSSLTAAQSQAQAQGLGPLSPEAAAAALLRQGGAPLTFAESVAMRKAAGQGSFTLTADAPEPVVAPAPVAASAPMAAPADPVAEEIQRRLVTAKVAKGQGPLAAYTDAGLTDAQAQAAYGADLASGRIKLVWDKNTKTYIPNVTPGQTLTADLDETRYAKLGGRAISGETAYRKYSQEKQRYESDQAAKATATAAATSQAAANRAESDSLASRYPAPAGTLPAGWNMRDASAASMAAQAPQAPRTPAEAAALMEQVLNSESTLSRVLRQPPPQASVLEAAVASVQLGGKTIWNTGVAAVAGTVGTVVTVVDNADSGANTIRSITDTLSAHPNSDAERQVAQSMYNVVGSKLEALKTTLGENAYQSSGSPLVATAASMTPEALLALIGLNSVRSTAAGLRSMGVADLTLDARTSSNVFGDAMKMDWSASPQAVRQAWTNVANEASAAAADVRYAGGATIDGATGAVITDSATAARPSLGYSAPARPLALADGAATEGSLKQLAAEYAAQDSGYVSRATQIQKVSTFEAQGLDAAAARSYLLGTEGKNLTSALWAADPAASARAIQLRAVDMLATGAELPTQQILSSPLVKIVPEGQSVSSYSPFFTTQSEVARITASGQTMADALGLPLSSEAPQYSLFEIKPLQPAGVFQSTVAPTTELGGLIGRTGGAQQYVVPNRALWSEPRLIGTVPNSGGVSASVPVSSLGGTGSGSTRGVSMPSTMPSVVPSWSTSGVAGPMGVPVGNVAASASPVAQGANVGAISPKPLFANMYPEHAIDLAKIVPTERLNGISDNFNYVINEKGNLVVGRSGHTSLAGGAPVQAAGELQLYNGNVKWIDNASGHYQPSSGIGQVAEAAFNNAGLDATGKFVPKIWVPNLTLPRRGAWLKTN